MTIKAVLYDLDGTLLAMDTEKLIEIYFRELHKRLLAEGFDGKAIMSAINEGIGMLIGNDGVRTNEDVFKGYMREVFGDSETERIETVLMDFYTKEFTRAREACGDNPAAAEVVALCRNLGLRQIVATNPLFPAVATYERISWTGCDASEFERITTYENSSYCKPNPLYYKEIIDRQGLLAEECLMVGNDIDEDMAAAELGMNVFLVTNNLINRSGKDIEQYPHGDFYDLIEYIKGM